MAQAIYRNDQSLLGQWWWSVDRLSLGAISLLMVLGLLMSFAASPGVANTLHISSFYFVIRHVIFLIPSFLLLVMISLMNVRQIRRLSLFLFFLSTALIFLTLFIGAEIKGARRWISFAGFSLQPSEFIKPAFTILSAWMLSEQRISKDFPGALIGFALYGFVVGLLLLQPDLGMVVLITLIWFSQLFIAGLSMVWIVIGGILGTAGLGLAYLLLPHVTRRMDQFFSGDTGDRYGDKYQITQSLEAFMSGGFLGQGPGEGMVKRNIPDAHADFVFSVAGEEFGALFCLILVAIYAFIVIRSLTRSLSQNSLFCIIAVSGLALQFGLQAIINMSSTLNLIPTKGMTLPFLSYGGSSMLALSMAMGMVLALTKSRVDGALR